MVEYIHAPLKILDTRALPNVIFLKDVNSLTNQSLFQHVKRDRSFSHAYNEWLGAVNAQGVGYLSHFTSTNARVEKVMITLESQINTQELEKVKQNEYIIDNSKVQEYGVDKF